MKTLAVIVRLRFLQQHPFRSQLPLFRKRPRRKKRTRVKRRAQSKHRILKNLPALQVQIGLAIDPKWSRRKCAVCEASGEKDGRVERNPSGVSRQYWLPTR